MNSVVSFPSPASEVASAPLPAVYEAARTALAECERIDECKTWSDKAAAMASYARQAKDDALRVMAVRIQARAQRRCGELLKLIPRGDEATRYGQAGEVAPVTRTQAATDAGLSEHQRKTVLRIAEVPKEQFEIAVESPQPPSITQLAEKGKSPGFHGREGAHPPGPKETSEPPEQETIEYETSPACAALAEFIRFCSENEPSRLARSCSREDAVTLRSSISKADRWLDRFVTHLPE